MAPRPDLGGQLRRGLHPEPPAQDRPPGGHTDSQADGSCTWTTQWGQVIHVPARPFLDLPDPPAIEYVDSEPEHGSDDPAPVSGAGPPSADDPPPF